LKISNMRDSVFFNVISHLTSLLHIYFTMKGKRKMKTEILFIGVDGEKTVNSQETLKQIEKVKSLECLLEHKGEPLISTLKTGGQ
jgi:hypothetical protein